MRYFSKKIIKNLKEAMENDNEFKKSLTEDREACVLCGKHIDGHGNNPAPLADEGKCCDECNSTKVIPARMKALRGKKRVDEDYDDLTSPMLLLYNFLDEAHEGAYVEGGQEWEDEELNDQETWEEIVDLYEEGDTVEGYIKKVRRISPEAADYIKEYCFEDEDIEECLHGHCHKVDKNYDDEPYKSPFHGVELEYDDDPNMDY